MRLLHFSSLFPNEQQPIHGVFVEQRLRHLLAGGEVSARVVAPVPRLPWGGVRVAEREERHGLVIHHPPFWHLPGLGMWLAPWSMVMACQGLVQRLAEEQPFDIIDAHYFYPDGVAAAWLARRLGKPLVITGRGTDLNLLPNHALPRRLIHWAANQADAIVTVCQALQTPLLDMGIPAQKITTLGNGVDGELFTPIPHELARQRLGITRPTLLMVGHLIERKNGPLVVEALRLLPEVALLVVGEGPLGERLREMVGEYGLQERVTFVGRVAHEEMPLYYSAADALVLASSREGWANCLLESMACGTPVAATDVWGSREVVSCEAAGVLIPAITPEEIARCCRLVLERPAHREATRAHALAHGWSATSAGQLKLFRQILGLPGR
ncbi:MAG: glycosyltransferase family 4 protein [Magnetococcales bacterium]|nr:glycosyltransferase family 4 protein [Magnetococcales bacterium]